jgi:hypothetical protein
MFSLTCILGVKEVEFYYLDGFFVGEIPNLHILVQVPYLCVFCCTLSRQYQAL